MLKGCIRKEERSQINHVRFHLKKLENGEQIKTKPSRRKVIPKTGAEVNGIGIFKNRENK